MYVKDETKPRSRYGDNVKKDDNEASCSSICSRDSLPIQSIHLNICDLLGGHKVRHAGMVKWPFEIKKSETSPKRPINKKKLFSGNSKQQLDT